MSKNKEIVTTIDGTTALRTECRYIKNGFYKVGDPEVLNSGQCYLVQGKYCRDGTGYIVFDYGLGKYVKKTETLVYGAVEVDSNGETLIMGHFTENEVYNVTVYDKLQNSCIVLQEEVLLHSYYRERLSDGTFHHISNLTAVEFNKKVVPHHIKRDLPYDSKGIMDDNIEIYNNFNNSIPSKMIRTHANRLDGLTFGLEFETSNGYIPKRITSKLGLLPLKDGSINGLEYVTIPLKGAQGMQTIIDTCGELQKRTTFDNGCSLHIHIGGMPRTQEFMVALYRVFASLQDEIFSYFPLYKKDNHGIKKKAYTAPLPVLNIFGKMDSKITKKNITANFEHLFEYFSMGQSFSDNFETLDDVKTHPFDPRGTQKWNIKPRYHWVNFIPLLFGNKQTIEFRIHTATFNGDKVLNFLCLCGALINFTKKNTQKLLTDVDFSINLSVKKLLFAEYGDQNITYNLFKYFQNRRYAISSQIKSQNILGNEKEIDRGRLNWGANKDIKKAYSSNIFINNADIQEQMHAQLLNAMRGEAPQAIREPEARAEQVGE